MLEFIQQYWLTFIFGLAATAITWAIKKSYEYRIQLDAQSKEDFRNEMKGCFEEALQPIQEDIKEIKDGLDSNTAGTLSLYKTIFYKECHKLINSDYISIEDFEHITKDHEIYNKLGGNSAGDQLYAQVEQKFINQ